MRIATLAVAAALLGAFASPVLAQQAPDPVAIEDWPLEKISAMGAEIYRHDIAAWVATDALIAHLAEAQPPEGMRGWIVVEDGADLQVRFVRDHGGQLTSVFDIPVRNGRAGPVTPTDAALSTAEIGSWRARETAIANIGRLRCSAQLNTVVLDDPDSDNWLVWLLTSTTDGNVVPVGGHYRFRISADGSTVLRRDMLSNGCLSVSRLTDADTETEALVVSQLVSRAPVETHVFLSIQNQLPFLVIIDEGLVYAVEGPLISKVDF